MCSRSQGSSKRPSGWGPGRRRRPGLAGGGIDAVRHGVRSLSRVLGCEKPPQGPPPKFDLGLIRPDIDPVTLAESLVGNAERGSAHRSWGVS